MSTRFVFVTLLCAVLVSSCSSPSDRPDQCHPCTVSKEVGPLLKEAQQMIAARNYEGATAKLNEAEAVRSRPDDETVINMMKQAVATCSAPDANCPAPPSQP